MEEETQKCPKCLVIMRKWFDRQVFTGFSCDNCGKFIKIESNPH